jgi:hypothetical protein
MNLYREAFTEDMRNAHEKVVRLVLPIEDMICVTYFVVGWEMGIE